MKYKFKKFNNDSRPTTSEFWYDMSSGGYLKPKDFSSDPATIEAIQDAIDLLKKLEQMCSLQ